VLAAWCTIQTQGSPVPKARKREAVAGILQPDEVLRKVERQFQRAPVLVHPINLGVATVPKLCILHRAQ